MSAGVETRETTRGAGDGPPSAVSPRTTPPAEPRLGPLPEPSLLARLRASWSLAALVPAFDPRGLRRREWRPAAALAVAVHAAMLVAIVVGRYVLPALGPERERPDITMLGPTEPNVAEPVKTGDDSSGKTHEDPPSPGKSGGGGNESKPATQGPLPRSIPTPPVIPPNLKTTSLTPSLPIDPSIQGPPIDVPAPSQVGLPGAPPAPGEPSAGTGPGLGVGNGDGNSGGSGRGGSPNGGSGIRGVGDPNGQIVGPGPDLTGRTPGPGVRDHGPKLVHKVKPRPTPAMIENGTDGTVTVRVKIGADGAILSAEPVQTVANGGTQAAMNALQSCRFEPAIRGGKYVTETTLVVFDFRKN